MHNTCCVDKRDPTTSIYTALPKINTVVGQSQNFIGTRVRGVGS